MLVRLSKRVCIQGKGIKTLIVDCFRELEMPIAPFVGMHVWLDEDDDPTTINGVCYETARGGIIWASIGCLVYDGSEDGHDPEGANSQMEFETEGWEVEIIDSDRKSRSSIWFIGFDDNTHILQEMYRKIKS